MRIFNFLKRKKDQVKIQEVKPKEEVTSNRGTPLYNSNGEKIKDSSVIDYSNGIRVLELPYDSCALILHNDSNMEVVMTKLINENQELTENEQVLYTLSFFIQQEGFCDLLESKMRDIAVQNLYNDSSKG